MIVSILDKAGIKHDDKSDKIEMLRKIELRLDYLVEARQHTEIRHRKELEDKEKELHSRRKEENLKRKKAKEQEFLDERARKNQERIEKQNATKIFKGKRDMQRAKKPDLKPKEANDDKPSQEALDQLRYLGAKMYDGEDSA